MKKEQAKALIESKLSPGENLISYFMAQRRTSPWMFILMGPLVVLAIRMYVVGVTDRGMHFQKLNILNKPSTHDSFLFDEIKSVKIGRGKIQLPMTFAFSSGQKITIRAMKRGVEALAKIDDDAVAYITRNIKAS